MARLSVVLAEVTQGGQASAGPLSQPLVLPQLGPKSRHPNLLGLGPLPPTLDERQHHLAQIEVVPPHVEGWQLHGTQSGGRWPEGGWGWGQRAGAAGGFLEQRGTAPPFILPKDPLSKGGA